jgi:nicotinate-nucleotide adenylyltransferase
LSRTIALFGGTFDPVHFGHLRSAVELVETLDLRELRFMPAAIPPHREAPLASGEHRAAMLELAIDGEPRLRCDRRELQRDGPSYSVLSLEELRGELGERQSLALVMGADALLSLPAWHRWRDILDLAHVIAIARPGWAWPESGAVAALLRERGAGALAVDALEDLKGVRTVTWMCASLSNIMDYLVISSGTSNRHVKSLAENVTRKAKEAGNPPQGVEGEDAGEWVLVDLGDVVVHVMQPATRDFYDLERLWTAGNRPEGIPD